MENKVLLKNLDKLEDIASNSFCGYPYTEEEQSILDTIDICREYSVKQIPVKAVKKCCPKCGRIVEREVRQNLVYTIYRDNYCSNCGQKIDWN